MTKAVLLSIHPKWAQKIYSGEKTIEWRKSFPFKKWHGEMKVYLYETKPVCKITGCFKLLNVVETTFKEYRVIHDSLIKKRMRPIRRLG